jgi:hypothetical protein
MQNTNDNQNSQEPPEETDSGAQYVRVTLADLQRLREADEKIANLQREIIERDLVLSQAVKSFNPVSQATESPLMSDDPDGAADAIHNAATAVHGALTQAGFLPAPSDPQSEEYVQHRRAPAELVRYALIWQAALNAHDLNMERQRAAQRASGYFVPDQAPSAPEARLRAVLTPVNIEVICQAIETGMSRKGAMALGGITSTTYESYKAKAKLSLEPYATLFDLVEVAEARVESKLVRRWEGATKDNWSAAAKLLERRFTNEWGERKIIEHSMQELSNMPVEKLAEMIGPEAQQWLQTARASDNVLDIPTLREEDFVGPDFDPNSLIEPDSPSV